MNLKRQRVKLTLTDGVCPIPTIFHTHTDSFSSQNISAWENNYMTEKWHNERETLLAWSLFLPALTMFSHIHGLQTWRMKIRFQYPLLHIAMALSPNDRPSWLYCPFSMSPSALHFFSVKINEKIWKGWVQWINNWYFRDTDKQIHLTLADHVQQCPASFHTAWYSTSIWLWITQRTFISHFFPVIEHWFVKIFVVQLLVQIFGWFATLIMSLRHWNREFQSTKMIVMKNAVTWLGNADYVKYMHVGCRTKKRTYILATESLNQ